MVSQPATEETGVVELVAFDADGNPIGDQCYTLSESAGASAHSATTVKATLQPIRACSRCRGCRSEP